MKNKFKNLKKSLKLSFYTSSPPSFPKAKSSKLKAPSYSKLKAKSYFLGFTIIETLVAVTILLFAVVSPLTIASKSLFSANVARDQVTAFYLVQDAVEYIRYIRDTNFLKNPSANWLLGLANCESPNFCTIDTSIPGGDVDLCPAGVCPKMRIDYDPITKTGTRFYGYTPAWRESSFTRVVSITRTDPEALISVTVNWNTGILSRSFSVSETIYDWQ